MHDAASNVAQYYVYYPLALAILALGLYALIGAPATGERSVSWSRVPACCCWL